MAAREGSLADRMYVSNQTDGLDNQRIDAINKAIISTIIGGVLLVGSAIAKLGFLGKAAATAGAMGFSSATLILVVSPLAFVCAGICFRRSKQLAGQMERVRLLDAAKGGSGRIQLGGVGQQPGVKAPAGPAPSPAKSPALPPISAKPSSTAAPTRPPTGPGKERIK